MIAVGSAVEPRQGLLDDSASKSYAEKVIQESIEVKGEDRKQAVTTEINEGV